MEFIWQPFKKHLGNNAQIFTHAMYSHYCFAPGQDYDDRWYGNDPTVDDKDLETFDADDKVNSMLTRIYDMLNVYRGDHLL